MKLDDIVNETKVAAALQYLAGSDESFANLKADVQKSEYLAKLEEAMAFKSISVGTVNDKQAEAKMSPTVQKRWDAHFVAVASYEKVRATRERAVLTTELWRSLNANRRVGNV